MRDVMMMSIPTKTSFKDFISAIKKGAGKEIS